MLQDITGAGGVAATGGIAGAVGGVVPAGIIGPVPWAGAEAVVAAAVTPEPAA